MTTEQIKEQLSNNFVGILAANKGFALDKPVIDCGVDYQLKKSISYVNPNGSRRYTFDSKYIDIQLKSTTESNIIYEVDKVKYDLEAKSYNDMIERQTNGIVPLVLILFVLPEDVDSWVEISLDEIKLRKHAYWYIPNIGSSHTPNAYTTRIEIPRINILDINFFNILHEQFYP